MMKYNIRTIFLCTFIPDQINKLVEKADVHTRSHTLRDLWLSHDSTSPTHTFTSIEGALAWCETHSEQRSLHVLCTGSLHLLGSVLQVLQKPETDSSV